MKRILIIEDERLSADRLRRMITDIDDTLEVVGPLSTVQEVIDTLHSAEDFDLIFSDIRLKDRLVFEAFHEVMPRSLVIFTTAYDEYALEAFKHNGIGYLLKPFDALELQEVMNRVKLAPAAPSAVSTSLNATAREMKCYRERILVSRGDELVPLRVGEIGYIRKMDEHVVGVMRDGTQYRLPLTMQELEEQLDPSLFFRLNRQFIAHIDSIRKISYFFSSKLIVRIKGCDVDNIVVSKEKSAQFKQWLDR